MRLKVVYDRMLLLQQAGKPHRVTETRRAVENQEVELFVSEEVLSELGDVLTLAKVRARFPALTDARAARFGDELRRMATVVPDVPHVFTVERDPKDSKYVDLAIKGQATYLVTRDKDLLELKDQEKGQPQELREAVPNLQILTPQKLVAVLEHEQYQKQQHEQEPGLDIEP